MKEEPFWPRHHLASQNAMLTTPKDYVVTLPAKSFEQLGIVRYQAGALEASGEEASF